MMMILVSINVHVAEAKSIGYDYVIITTDNLKDSLTDFKNWKEELGYSVNITTVSWIYDNYPGKDEPEKIRNFLIDKYETWGIKFVLIVGSIYTVPMRYCYPDPSTHDNDWWRIPTDFYYADLTGNWDADGDGYYGEGLNYSIAPEFGNFNSTEEQNEYNFQFFDDKMNFNVSVYVGRFPTDNPKELQDICNRSIEFEKSTESWKKKVLLMGPYLEYDTVYPWEFDQGYFMEQLKTKIFKPNNYQVTTMYEKEGLLPCPLECNYSINEKNVLKYWQEGHGIVCWGGHGWETGSIRRVWEYDDGDEIPENNESEITSYDYINVKNISILRNGKPSIDFSISCGNAYPENVNCLGDALIKNISVAFIGAPRINYIGAGSNVSENWSGSAAICEHFFRFLIDENQTCGEAIYNSKKYCYDEGIWMSLVNIYGFNLYGDPSLKIQYKTIEDNPPNIPSNPSPSNGASNISINTTLSWTGGDIDQGDTITYDIYFGTDNPPQKIINNQSTATYNPGTLNYQTTYYWKIVAWDSHDATTPSSIWSFTTQIQPNTSQVNGTGNNNTNTKGTSGFELIIILLAIVLVLFWQRRRI